MVCCGLACVLLLLLLRRSSARSRPACLVPLSFSAQASLPECVLDEALSTDELVVCYLELKGTSPGTAHTRIIFFARFSFCAGCAADRGNSNMCLSLRGLGWIYTAQRHGLRHRLFLSEYSTVRHNLLNLVHLMMPLCCLVCNTRCGPADHDVPTDGPGRYRSLWHRPTHCAGACFSWELLH